jgi:hypothetical protein
MHADEDAAGEGANAGHAADRAPTDEEAATAERVAADVDLSEVSEHEEEMAQKGANAKGEGVIE